MAQPHVCSEKASVGRGREKAAGRRVVQWGEDAPGGLWGAGRSKELRKGETGKRDESAAG